MSVEVIIPKLFRDFSIEILPEDTERYSDFREHLPVGTRVYVAYTGENAAGVVRAAEALRRQGMIPVPHLPARRITSKRALSSFVDALRASAGIEEVLLIAGDCSEAAGPFSASIDILRTGLLERSGITGFAVAGHPEGHRSVDAESLRRALVEKRAYAEGAGLAMHVITQFCFDTAQLIRWCRDIRENVVPGVPVDVGIPGLAKMTTLLRFAKSCGVGTSLSMLTKNFGRALQLSTNYSADQMILELARQKGAARQPLFRSVHLFPFGSFERTAAWARSLAEGKIQVGRRTSTIGTA